MSKLYRIYTIIAATIIFLSSLILLSGPVRTANLIIITPLVALAWINFTNPQKTSESIWSLRMLVVVFVLTLLGVLVFRLRPVEPQPVTCPVCSSLAPSTALGTIDSPSPLPLTNLVVGAVTITNPAGARLDPEGTASYQQTYPYIDFKDGSFLIILDATKSAWVKLEDVIP